MAEMNIKSGPLRIRVVDDRGKTVAALRYPRVKWSELVIEAEDGDVEVDRIGPRKVVLTRRPDETAGAGGGGSDPLDAARQLGESLDVLVRDFAKGVKDLFGL